MSNEDDLERQGAVFDAIGERYDEVFQHKQVQVAATQWLAERLPRGARVLDAGSGTGLPTARLLAEAGHDVYGVDVSNEMLRLARRNVPGARFERRDLAALELEAASLDAAVAFFSLLMLPRARIVSTVAQYVQALRPGGWLVVGMVEGDFDHVEVPFLGQTIRVSAYPQHAFAAVMEAAGVEVVRQDVAEHPSAAPEMPPERQIVYCGQVV